MQHVMEGAVCVLQLGKMTPHNIHGTSYLHAVRRVLQFQFHAKIHQLSEITSSSIAKCCVTLYRSPTVCISDKLTKCPYLRCNSPPLRTTSTLSFGLSMVPLMFSFLLKFTLLELSSFNFLSEKVCSSSPLLFCRDFPFLYRGAHFWNSLVLMSRRSGHLLK